MKEIVLTESLTAQYKKLAYAALAGHLPNSILFSGVDGGASLAIALKLAQLMVCINHLGATQACNQCQNCLQFHLFNYPDLHFSFPFSKSLTKSKDPVCDEFRNQFTSELTESPFLTSERWMRSLDAGNSQFIIPVAEAKSINRKLSLSAFSSKPRFVFIWQPEKLHNTTANKLLKIIEEPGENVYFFLITHQFDAILKTITSRCVSVKIPKHSNNELNQTLKSLLKNNDDYAPLLVTANGSVGAVLDNLNEVAEYNALASSLIDWLRLIYANKIVELIAWSEKMASNTREEIKSFLDYASQITEQAILIRLNSTTQLSFKHQNFDLANFAPFIQEKAHASILKSLEMCKKDIARNASAKITLLDCSLQLTKYIGKA